MPLPTDESIVALSEKIVATLQGLFGKHPGYRPAHARGALLTGTFTPTPLAGTLSSAPHFSAPVPVTARFSSSTGIPNLPDTDPNAQPRGLGLRFHLGGRKHTDLVGHSAPAFPVSSGEDFLAFFEAVIASNGVETHPTPVEQFVGSHPAALKFVTLPKPAPSSFAKEAYYMLNAFRLISSAGVATTIRYQVQPVLGVDGLTAEALAEKGPNYLFDEVASHVAESGPLKFKLIAQVAQEGDPTDDVTKEWPESREKVELGEVVLDAYVEEGKQHGDAKYMIFDPIPRVEGVEASDDPLLEVRAAVYLISGRQRRAA